MINLLTCMSRWAFATASSLPAQRVGATAASAHQRIGFAMLLIVWLGLSSVALAIEPSSDWLGFRGDSAGVAQDGPKTLALGDAGNRTWKLKMPGRSVAGPIVIGDLIVTTSSAGPDEENLFVTGVDLSSGQTRWQQQFRATGRPYFHPTSAGAAPSPVSDGKRIVAFYSSNDLVCLTTEGQLLWYRGLGQDYPKAGNDVGMASSPVIAGETVIVQAESQGDSFVAGINLSTGENRWRIQRPAMSNWSSPVAVKVERTSDGDADQWLVVMQSREDLVALDALSGETQWSFDEGRNAISSATIVGDQLLSPGDDLIAYRLTGAKETPTELWRENKLSPRSVSVIAGDGVLYSLKGSVLLKGELQSGDILWKERLSGLGSTWATPVAAGNHVYVFDQAGVGLMIEDQGDSAETIAEIQLEDGVLGTPALAGGKLIVRSKTMLHCFE